MKYTRVRRAVSAVVIDSWDEDRNPEHIKVNGNVTFRPLLNDGDVVQWAGPNGPESLVPVSYTHLTLPTTLHECRSRWSPCH